MRGGSGPNHHLHIFLAHRDPTDDRWYFFDPYGIYGPTECYPTRDDAADSNDDGKLDVSDAISTLNCLFIRPCALTGCQRDLTPDDGLGCREYRACAGG